MDFRFSRSEEIQCFCKLYRLMINASGMELITYANSNKIKYLFIKWIFCHLIQRKRNTLRFARTFPAYFQGINAELF